MSLPIVPRPKGALATLVRADCAVFDAVARAHAPGLDRAVPALSRSANRSLLWIATATLLGAFGGRRGKRAGVRGVGSIAVTSLLVNQGVKRVVRRPRPALRNVPAGRRVKIPPLTMSFPSGHAGSAAAFATGVAVELPRAGPPLGLLAAAVGASRVYVGAHYPLDVAVGAATGAGVALLTRRVWPALPARVETVPPSHDRRTLEARGDGHGVALVLNPAAGSGLDDAFVAHVRAALPNARILDGAELEDALTEAARDCDVLGVAGGDGTILTAAEIALQHSRPLLALPGGTLNHLARDLRVERADDALEALRCGEAVGVDVATVDGRPFLNSAGFGAYPEMVATTDRLRKRVGRWPARLFAFVKTLLDARPLEVTLDGDRRSVWMGFVGNCRHEPHGLAPSWRPSLDDGRLDVRLLAADVPRSRLRLLLAGLTGRLTRSPAYLEYLATELRVESPHARLRLARDGEHFEAAGSFSIEKQPERLVVYARHQPGTLPPRSNRAGV